MRIAIFTADSNPEIDLPMFSMTRKAFDRDGMTRFVRVLSPYSAQLIEGGDFKSKAQQAASAPRAWTSCDKSERQAAIIPPRQSGACEICGFNRSIEKAHIIPSRFGGPAYPHNLMDLCPNHHTLFDRDLLSWAEMEKIWPRVGSALADRISDPRFDAWRSKLTLLYGVSFTD